jgi:hypothetical protein
MNSIVKLSFRPKDQRKVFSKAWTPRSVRLLTLECCFRKSKTIPPIFNNTISLEISLQGLLKRPDGPITARPKAVGQK